MFIHYNVTCVLQQVTRVLMVISVYWSSALSQSCEMDIDAGDSEHFNISCDTLPNALNASWEANSYVRELRIDYTCTIAGSKQVTGNLYGWGRSLDGNNLIDPILPTATYPMNTEPTCYLGGCYVWTSPRARFPTWSIPTVSCTDFYTSRISEATTEGITISNFYTSRISEASISSQGSSSSVPSPGYGNGSDYFQAAAGVRRYIWIILGVTITVLLIILMVLVCVLIAVIKVPTKNNGQIRLEETKEIVGQNTLEITEHEESPTLGIHAYRLKNEHSRHGCVHESTTETRSNQQEAVGVGDMKSDTVSTRGTKDDECAAPSTNQPAKEKQTGVHAITATDTLRTAILVALGVKKPGDTLVDNSILLADVERELDEERQIPIMTPTVQPLSLGDRQ